MKHRVNGANESMWRKYFKTAEKKIKKKRREK